MTRPLREACDHGRYERHQDGGTWDRAAGGHWIQYWCDGGRDVTDDELRLLLDDLAKQEAARRQV